MSTFVKSNVNDLISRMTDPGKEVDLLIDEMEDSARKARLEVKTCMAEEKRLGQQAVKQRQEAADWERRAMQAVEQGDDNLAREALRRKAEAQEQAAATDKAALEQKAYVDQLLASLKALDQRVTEVKARRGTLKQQARAAKGGNADKLSAGTSAFSDFERMSSKIDQIEAEADLDRELATRDGRDPDAERKLRELEHKSSVDDALAELKKKLNQ